MNRRLKDALASLPSQARMSLTYDNGTENAYHLRTNRAFGTKSYFCAPFHSWKKGAVENSIDLVRRYLPKKTDLAKVSWRNLSPSKDDLIIDPENVLALKLWWKSFGTVLHLLVKFGIYIVGVRN
jgi:IS30 family transposase